MFALLLPSLIVSLLEVDGPRSHSMYIPRDAQCTPVWGLLLTLAEALFAMYNEELNGGLTIR